MVDEPRTLPCPAPRDSAIPGPCLPPGGGDRQPSSAPRREISLTGYSTALKTPFRAVSAQKPALFCHTAQENAEKPEQRGPNLKQRALSAQLRIPRCDTRM